MFIAYCKQIQLKKSIHIHIHIHIHSITSEGRLKDIKAVLGLHLFINLSLHHFRVDSFGFGKSSCRSPFAFCSSHCATQSFLFGIRYAGECRATGWRLERYMCVCRDEKGIDLCAAHDQLTETTWASPVD